MDVKEVNHGPAELFVYIIGIFVCMWINGYHWLYMKNKLKGIVKINLPLLQHYYILLMISVVLFGIIGFYIMRSAMDYQDKKGAWSELTNAERLAVSTHIGVIVVVFALLYLSIAGYEAYRLLYIIAKGEDNVWTLTIYSGLYVGAYAVTMIVTSYIASIFFLIRKKRILGSDTKVVRVKT
jgi:ABC-type Fe3+ transport system permease subunit